jgi:hypothetical protein
MNNSPLRTILFGRSILLAGLEASLNNHLNIKVLKRVEEIEELEQISSNEVDIVLFDNSLPEAKGIPALFSARSNLLVVGIDLSTHHLTFYSGKEFTVNNFSEIANFIYEQANI